MKTSDSYGFKEEYEVRLLISVLLLPVLVVINRSVSGVVGYSSKSCKVIISSSSHDHFAVVVVFLEIVKYANVITLT